MASKILKIPFAMRDGRLVHISEVDSGLRQDCVCPECKMPLVARKGALKVHHFAHSTETNCQPETVAHLLGKQLLAEKIAVAIQSKIPVPVTWKCGECHDSHEMNLVQDVAQVRLEHSLGSLRPDIVLFGADDKVRAVVEIVVSHAPEENVLGYCTTNKIPVFEYRIKKIGDLEAMRMAERLDPSKATFCTRPKCEKCGKPLFPRMLFVVPGKCWKCDVDMQIAFVGCGGMPLSPEEMTDAEVAEAEKRGAILHMNASATRGETCRSNTCPFCGMPTGNEYLHNFWHLADEDHGLPTGMCCMDCELEDTEADEGVFPA